MVEPRLHPSLFITLMSLTAENLKLRITVYRVLKSVVFQQKDKACQPR